MKNFLSYFFICTIFVFGQDTRDTRTMGVLSFSGFEIMNIREFVKGSTYIDEQIEKRDFLNKLSKYDIIHLATHTFVDKKNPLQSKFYISNSDIKSEEEKAVYTWDILPLNLKAKMAILSSCNTGVGELVEGEGIMSLARDFQFAGVPSVIMTLWEINDISTAEVMKSFYSELKNGSKIDEAFRTANLEYLKNSISKNSAPVFWAASVPIGDMEKMNFNESYVEWIYLAVFSLLFFIWIFYRSFRKTT